MIAYSRACPFQSVFVSNLHQEINVLHRTYFKVFPHGEGSTRISSVSNQSAASCFRSAGCRKMAAPTVGSGASTKVLRVLALHGYWQNEHSFRERTGSLRKNLKNRAELVMISAPLTIPEPECEDGDSQREDPRGWWFSDPEKNSFNALDETQSCAGLEESLDVVAKAFSELGPFDGILGFSQGAAFAAMLCALKQQGDPRFQFDFAILVAGFRSRASDHTRFYKDPITVPSLHVFGDTDRVIPGDLSQELAAHFVNPVLLTHSGGHYIPVCAAQKKVYFPFLDSFRK